MSWHPGNGMKLSCAHEVLTFSLGIASLQVLVWLVCLR